MSIFISSKVWEHSTATEATLLVHLAIAEFADEDGYAYPSIATLAQKTRVSERTVQRAIRWLRVSGEIEIIAKAGMRGCNLYRVITDRRVPTEATQHARPETRTRDLCGNPGGGDKMKETSFATIRDDICEGSGRRLRPTETTCVSPEPSVNRQLTVIKPSARARRRVKQTELAIEPTSKVDQVDDLPPGWSSELRQAWSDWCDHLREQRKSITPTARRMQLAELAGWTEKQAIANIKHAIARNWRGIYDQPQFTRSGRGSTPVPHERLTPEAEARRRAF
jgi:hypothetical protein